MRNELETLRMESSSGLAAGKLNADNAELKRITETLQLQVRNMKAEGADKIEEEKRLAVESLTNQLARSREEIATLIEAKDLLERGPEDEDEATEDTVRVNKMTELLTLQRQRDVKAAASVGTVNAAVSMVLAACAIGSLVTLAYYVPTMPTVTAATGRRALGTEPDLLPMPPPESLYRDNISLALLAEHDGLIETDHTFRALQESADPMRVAWTKLALDGMAFVLLVLLMVREYSGSKSTATAGAGKHTLNNAPVACECARTSLTDCM